MKKGIRNHFNNKLDKRYTVTLEFCGYAQVRHVARFCGEWIGQDLENKQAWVLAQEHYDNHKIDGAV